MKLGILEKVQVTVFSSTYGSISLGRGGQKHLEKWSSAFSCTATAVCHFAKAKAPTPQGIHHPSQRGSKQMLRGFRFLFCCSGIPAAHCSGNTALFSNREDGPAYIPITQLSYGLMKIMNPGHGEGTGCGCASRGGVQVASPLCRGAKGQETCGAKGAEEKVVSPDSVFLMTCISKRKARGYRKWLSLTAPGECGKPAYLSVLSWLAGAMLNRSNGLRMGSRMQSSLRAFNQDLSFFFPY